MAVERNITMSTAQGNSPYHVTRAEIRREAASIWAGLNDSVQGIQQVRTAREVKEMAQEDSNRTYDVFISHSPKDRAASDEDKPSAYAICRHLEAEGIRCWIAPRDVTLGQDCLEQTSVAVEQSRIVVLVVSSESLASKQAEDEFQMALKAAKTIIPVRMEYVDLKGSFGEQLSVLSWLDAVDQPFENWAKELVDRVRGCLGGGPAMELRVQLAVQPLEADSLYEEAVMWMRRAAEQGHAGAQANLGFCYKHGQGVPRDYEEAVMWYLKGAEQGHPWAQNDLGFCYDEGQGVPQDCEEAVKWYLKAAEQGYAVAQYNLGYAYEFGRGLPQDYEEAAKWYRKSAEQDDVEASYRLGVTLQALARTRLAA